MTPLGLRILAVIIVASSSGCGAGGNASDASVDAALVRDAADATVDPMVIATTPADAAVGVDRIVTIEATFSRDMEATSLDETTFVVSPSSAAQA